LAFATDSRGQSTDEGTVVGHVELVREGVRVPRGRDHRDGDVWVYLERVPERRERRPPDPKEPPMIGVIEQKHEEFTPHTLVVPTGSVVRFPNLDREEHNVFSPTAPVFDLLRYNTDTTGKKHRFSDPGEVRIYCDIHQHMWARIYVVDAAYTDPKWIVRVTADGDFAIHRVPAGSYKVHAWTYASAPVPESISVASGTTHVPEMHLQLGQLEPHTRKPGSGGGTNWPYP
jgi:hypothetical protein